jgi:hypothetical protein
MRSRRPGTSLFLVAGALLLLVSIVVGQRLGDSVLRGATEQRDTEAGPIMTPVPQASESPDPARNWKREQVVSVATDPDFPDPRATPRPTPTPAPTPYPNPTIQPFTTPMPTEESEPTKPAYTSPPLPLPIASHDPDEIDTEPPDANGYPQGIPPVTPEPTPPR